MPDAGEDVGEEAPAPLVVEHLDARDERDAEADGRDAQGGLLAHLLGAAVAGDERVEPIAEGVGAALEGDRIGRERDEPLGALGELARGDERLALGPPRVAERQHPREAPIALAGLREQHDAARVLGHLPDGDLGAGEDPHADLAAAHPRAHQAVDRVAIGDRERVEPERVRGVDELLGVAGALEERAVRLHPQRYVRQSRTIQSTVPWRNQRRRSR